MKSKRGVTLIELIVSMAIVVVVFAMSFVMNLFGTRTFVMGRTEYDVQVDTRMLANYLSDEVRNATSVYLVTPTNASDYKRIYLDTSDQTVKVTANGNTVLKTGPIFMEANDFSLSLVKENDQYYLSYHLFGRDDDQSQLVESRILLNNFNPKQSGVLLNGMQTVYYRTSVNLSSPSFPDWELPGVSPSPTPTPIPPTPTPDPSATPTPVPDPNIYTINFTVKKIGNNAFTFEISNNEISTNVFDFSSGLFGSGAGSNKFATVTMSFPDDNYCFRFNEGTKYRDVIIEIPGNNDNDGDHIIGVDVDF